MGQPLKIEDPNCTFLITTRTISSRLWFLHNKSLESSILAYLARYLEMYSAIAYGFIIMGNHYHLIAKFPMCNKASFCRAFNAMVAKLTQSHVKSFEGKLWARRYADQFLPNNEDIEHYFFYAALNPISSGVTRNIHKYKSYNSFFDAVNGTEKKFKIYEKSAYNEALRRGHYVQKEDFIKSHTLKFSRLPGYEKLSSEEYRNHMQTTKEVRTAVLVEARIKSGKGFADESKVILCSGDKPVKTKKSERDSFRPIVLSLCNKTKDTFLAWYFSIKAQFKEASKKYRSGDVLAKFPEGTYRPLLYAH